MYFQYAGEYLVAAFTRCFVGQCKCTSVKWLLLLLGSGAYAVETWKDGCTHVLVDEGSAVNEMVIAAVASSKPVVQINWWQVERLHNLLSVFAVAIS